MKNPWRLWSLCSVTFLASAIGGSAQEIRAIKLEWKTAADVGVTDPKITHLVHKPASSSLAQRTDILYVETAPLISQGNEPGRTIINLRPNAVLPGIEPLRSDASRLTMTPDIPQLTGDRADRTRIIFIYNPARDAGGPPARLLEINPPFKPEGVHQKWVWVDVTLDHKGNVTNATAEEGTKPELAELVVASVKKWRFSEPWRTNDKGQASWRVPVVLSNRGKSPMGGQRETPKARPELIDHPDFSEIPFGSGAFEVKVDKTGRVTALTLIQSNNPEWAEAMVDYYFACEYKPLTKDGQPIESTFKEGQGLGGRITTTPGMTVTETPQFTQISPATGTGHIKNYDTPPVVRNLPIGVYPFELVAQAVEEKISLPLAIDREGRVAQPTTVGTSHDELRFAVRAMIDAYHFLPAKRKDQPVATTFMSDIRFGPRKGEVHLSKSALAICELLKEDPTSIAPAEAADHAPEQIVFLKPVMPSSSWCQATTGSAEIEFFIDKKGHAQLPHIVKADDPAFGYAAAQAVAFWRFQPVQKDGRPVVARSRVTLNFPRDCSSTKLQPTYSDMP